MKLKNIIFTIGGFFVMYNVGKVVGKTECLKEIMTKYTIDEVSVDEITVDLGVGSGNTISVSKKFRSGGDDND